MRERFQLHKYKHGKNGRPSTCVRCGTKRRATRYRSENGRIRIGDWEYKAGLGCGQIWTPRWQTQKPRCVVRS